MIFEGIKIMILGMGTVFVMLTTLIVSTIIASRLISACSSGHESTQPPSNAEGGKPLTAIIAAAVALFRKQRNQ
jgi:Na+-transporting methylmalonyl-CoA/oxaloacetate decarboxylase gamma subunit